jgi:capsular polysaccharide biosynthesis protein
MKTNNTILLVVGVLLVSAIYAFFVLNALQQKPVQVVVTKQQLLEAQSLLKDIDPMQEKSTTPFAEDLLSDDSLGLK